MMIQTTVGVPMDATMLNNYFRALVNLFFKILPIMESGESSLEGGFFHEQNWKAA